MSDTQVVIVQLSQLSFETCQNSLEEEYHDFGQLPENPYPIVSFFFAKSESILIMAHKSSFHCKRFLYGTTGTAKEILKRTQTWKSYMLGQHLPKYICLGYFYGCAKINCRSASLAVAGVDYFSLFYSNRWRYIH